MDIIADLCSLIARRGYIARYRSEAMPVPIPHAIGDVVAAGFKALIGVDEGWIVNVDTNEWTINLKVRMRQRQISDKLWITQGHTWLSHAVV